MFADDGGSGGSGNGVAATSALFFCAAVVVEFHILAFTIKALICTSTAISDIFSSENAQPSELDAWFRHIERHSPNWKTGIFQ